VAERHPREAPLRRVYGTSDLFSAAYGNVGSTPYYALGVTAAFALGLTPLAFLIAGVIFVATAATYVEGTVMYPEAGGSASFARHAFNELVSFVAGWGQMLNYVITVAISAFFVPHYLAVFWEPLGEGPVDIVAAIVLIALLAALNVRGTKESARLNLVLAIADLLTQALLVGIGVALVLDPQILVDNVELGVAPTWGNFALGIAVGMIAFTGIETISNMAEEARDASRTVANGTRLTVLAVLFMYALLPVIALSAMPVTQEPASGAYATELGTTYAGDPVLGIVENMGLSAGLTDALRYYVGLLAAVILLIATNAALIGVSRLSFSMGQHRQLPDRIRQVHVRFKTPYVAILVFSAVAVLAILPGQVDFLATMYSFGAMLSFTIAHVSVARLRQVQPDRERPWMPPLNVRFHGGKFPLSAIVGGLGTFAAWIVVISLDLGTLAAGATWMGVGLVTYFLYRRHQALPLRQTVKVETLEPLGVEEIEYRSVLVAFEEDPFSQEMVTTAKRLGANRRRAIHVLSLVQVPTHLPIDARLDEQDGIAQSKIERAKLLCGQRAAGSIMRVRPGQAGQAIVQRAKEIDAEAIVMQLRYRNGVPLYGKTLQTVLTERPTRVIVAANPDEARAGIAATLPDEGQRRRRFGSRLRRK
jgi:APA family basic amino acid/polyamine antiporter